MTSQKSRTEQNEQCSELRRCPTTEPEPHLLGEFPMSCYRCHLEADA